MKNKKCLYEKGKKCFYFECHWDNKCSAKDENGRPNYASYQKIMNNIKENYKIRSKKNGDQK